MQAPSLIASLCESLGALFSWFCELHSHSVLSTSGFYKSSSSLRFSELHLVDCGFIHLISLDEAFLLPMR